MSRDTSSSTGLTPALHAPGGVYARPDFENHIGNGDFPVGEVADAYYRPQPHGGIAVKARLNP